VPHSHAFGRAIGAAEAQGNEMVDLVVRMRSWRQSITRQDFVTTRVGDLRLPTTLHFLVLLEIRVGVCDGPQ
jgi:hypothetical protein